MTKLLEDELQTYQRHAVFGNVPFLVKEIVRVEVPKKIFSPLLRV